MFMTFKEEIEKAAAAQATTAEAAELERNMKSAELQAIAEKLEQYLADEDPAGVGLELAREGSRMMLKSKDYTIVIDAGFQEYKAFVTSHGVSPEIARGSPRRLSTLPDVSAYVLDILQGE
jgi:hypothetical protein